MRVALGLKAHSGWAALVCVGTDRDGIQIVDRRRIELVEHDAMWAKQPYHAAENLEAEAGRDIVKRGTESAHRIALRRMQEIVAQSRASKHDIAACAVLRPEPMPDWTTAQILAVHFRMHKAEGVLFPDALCRAAAVCNLALVEIPEKEIDAVAEKKLGLSIGRVMQRVAVLGKSVGAPWGKDQKVATVAALIALGNL